MNTNQNKHNTLSEHDFYLLKKADDIHNYDARNLALIHQVYADGYLQRQLAEECSELAQAALKLIRARNDETPEPMQQVSNNYVEELADVWVMLSLALQELDADEMQYCADVCQYKRDRLYQRLCEAAQQQGDYAKTAEDDVACPRCYAEKDDAPDQDDVWDQLDAAWADMDEALTQLEAQRMEQQAEQAEQTEQVCRQRDRATRLKAAAKRMLDMMPEDEFKQALREAIRSE